MRFFVILISLVFSEFIATNEWQVIPENEPLPQGLHYRINLETGEKEAKLLEDEIPDKGGLVATGELIDKTPSKEDENFTDL